MSRRGVSGAAGAASAGAGSSTRAGKAFSRGELVELQAAVNALRRESDNQAAAFAESHSSFDYMGSQIEALRKAYATLSDVLIDEVDAVRSETRTVRSDADARLRDVEAQAARTAKATKSLRLEVAALKEENSRLRDDVAGARADAEDGDARLESTIRGLEGEVGALRSENQSLREVLAASLGELREQMVAVQSEVASLSERASEIPKLALEIGDVRSGLADEVRAGSAARSSLATLADGVALLQSDLTQVRSLVHQVKEDGSAASTALAQDVALLAKDAASSKAKAQAESDKVAAQLKALGETAEKQHADAMDRLQTRISNLGREIGVQQEQMRQALFAVQKQQNRMRGSLEEGLRSASAEAKAVGSQTSALESALSATSAELRRRLDEAAEDSQRQFDAVNQAVHAFADILHVSSPLVST